MAKPVELSEVIGGYVLERVLGRGGMGTVFLGKHRLLGRPAAVKVLDSEMAGNEQLVSRFFHEAKIVNDVRHPNIVDVIDFVRTEDPRRVAFIMEYLDGDSLDRFLKERGPLPPVQAINTILQILDGLSAVHAVGVIHRDLKPANLRFTTKALGDCSTVPIIKILDFGIAKASGPMVAHKTQTGLVMGTPAYMAPEQVSGDAVSPASDIYAVGEIMYELLGGRRLFGGTNTEVLRAKLAPEPPSIELPHEMPSKAELVNIIRACVAFDGARRPTTDALIETLRELRPSLIGASLVGAAAHDLGDGAKPTAMIPVPTPAPLRTPQPYRPTPAARTPAPVKPPLATRTNAPLRAPQPVLPADTPAPMNTLAAEKSLYSVPPPFARPILPIVLGLSLVAVAGAALFLATRPTEPIVVHSIPDPTPERPIEPPPPPPVAIAPDPPPPPLEPEPTRAEPEQKKEKKKKKKRESRRARAERTETAPPPPVVEEAESKFGRIKVSAWTTAGRQVPATVKIDGRAVERTAPLEIKARVGRRRVEVEAVGHPAKTQEVVVEDGETTTVDVVVDLR